MAVAGLPTADSLLASIAALRRKLATEEAGFRASTFSATSSDGKVTATVNGMVEALTVAIDPAAWAAASTATLAASLKDACSKALAQAIANSKPKASADASGYALTGIPNANQPLPSTPNLASAVSDLISTLRAQDAVIAAKLFEGISDPVTAVVDGTLSLSTLGVTSPLPPVREALENAVVVALNIALEKAKHLFEDGIEQRVDDGIQIISVAFSASCLWSQTSLKLADRVKVKRQDGTFAPVVNSGAAETNVGVEAQVGDLWSRGPVVLRDRSRVNGSVRTRSTVKQHSGVVVTGATIQNGLFVQIPTLSLNVTFPGTNQGPVPVAPDQTRTLAPGAYADVSVQSRATLFLTAGTYFFNNWTIEPQAKISCTSGSGQVVIHVKNGFTFRGSIVEKTGGRPKLFVGVFGSNLVSIGAPFTGTLVALNAPVNLATVSSPGHSGAFYAKDLTVEPDNTVTHFPFSGPPLLVMS